MGGTVQGKQEINNVLDDSTVVGECCFFGSGVCTKVFLFAINFDLC